MNKAEPINAPHTDDKANKRQLSNEEYTEKNNGEQSSNGWHDLIELESVNKSSSNHSWHTIHDSINTWNNNKYFDVDGRPTWLTSSNKHKPVIVTLSKAERFPVSKNSTSNSKEEKASKKEKIEIKTSEGVIEKIRNRLPKYKGKTQN